MWTKLWEKGWVRQLVVFVGYLLMYAAARPFSSTRWALIAPLRLTCLLFIPYRYWLVLAIADVFGQSYIVLSHASQFGIVWAVASLIPNIAVAMPIVWWCRSKLMIFPTKQLINFQILLLCSVLVSLAWALLTMLAALYSFQSPGHRFTVTPIMLPAGFIGKYITIVAMMPWVLMARAEYLSIEPWRKRLHNITKQVFAADTLVLLLSVVIFLLWLNHLSLEDAKRLSYLAVFMPIAWLTLKPGWRAAALGGTPAIFCIVSLLEIKPYEASVKSETFIAFVVTCMFMLGARITAQRQQEEQERLDANQAILLARQNIHLSELRLSKTAQALELAGSAIYLSHQQLLARFRHMLPVNEAQRYYRQAAATQSQVSQLADSMHPSAWRDRGLPAALHETIASALHGAGIAYHCQIDGRKLSELTPGLHGAIYRLACESIVHINAQMICSRISLRLRDGVTNGVHWVVLRVEGAIEHSRINDAIYDLGERDFLASKLGAQGFGLESLQNHVRLFDGKLHVRTTHKGMRLTYLLIDELIQSQQRRSTLATVQPWIS